jgi:hypothetical protein
MGYKIDYSDMSGDKKVLEALKNIDNWFGNQKIFVDTIQRKMKFQDIFFDAVAYGCSYKQYSFLFGMNGVSGYPVVAFWNEVKDSLHTMTQ